MSTEARIEQNSLIITDWWEPPMPPNDLIFDDGEPMESNRHRIAINILIRSINQALANRDDFFAGAQDYYVFNPFDADSLQGWHLDTNQQYQPLTPNEQGWIKTK